MSLAAAASATYLFESLEERLKRLTKKQKIAIGVGLAAGGAITIGLLLPKAAAQVQVATITFNADRSSGQVPFDPNFTGRALDSSGNPVAGASLSFMVNGLMVSSVTADSSGSFSFQTEFSKAGDYKCYMQAGRANSNTLTLTAISQLIISGYSIGLSQTDLGQIINNGILMLTDAISQAQTYANGSGKTVYIFDTDSSGKTTFVQSVAPQGPQSPFLLEVYDKNGVRTFEQQYSTVSEAESYLGGVYNISQTPQANVSGTYDIFDKTALLLESGYIAPLAASTTQQPPPPPPPPPITTTSQFYSLKGADGSFQGNAIDLNTAQSLAAAKAQVLNMAISIYDPSGALVSTAQPPSPVSTATQPVVYSIWVYIPPGTDLTYLNQTVGLGIVGAPGAANPVASTTTGISGAQSLVSGYIQAWSPFIPGLKVWYQPQGTPPQIPP